MTKGKKDAFLILRVEEDFKTKVMDRAKKVGETVSEFVRKVLTKEI